MPTPKGKGERQKIRVTSVLESQLEIACLLKQVIASLYEQHKPKLRGIRVLFDTASHTSFVTSRVAKGFGLETLRR